METVRAGQFAQALAAFIRAQAELPLQAIAGDPCCLDLAGQLLAVLQAGNGARRAERGAGGRPPRHDAEWAQAALLDAVARDPDGLPARQGVLVERLAAAFAAAGRDVPGTFWLKAQVREFHRRVAAFEVEALADFRASPDLQSVFSSEAEFLAFRRHQRSLDAKFGRKPQRANGGSQESEKHAVAIL